MPMHWMVEPESWIALLTLTVLEVVLGIDNIIFIGILASRLPDAQRGRARRLGLGIGVGLRIVLLFSLTYVMRLTDPLFSVLGRDISARDLILLAGGLFLIVKSTREIHFRLEGESQTHAHRKEPTFGAVLVQVALLDIAFSVDSVITAVGMTDKLVVMIIAMLIAVGCMMAAASPLAEFVERHPTVAMLALSFLLLIGVSLIAEALHQPIPKGYIYFAIAFSALTEMLNLKVKSAMAKRARR
jgi:predicted tellurium resistance membrane protein TerC